MISDFILILLYICVCIEIKNDISIIWMCVYIEIKNNIIWKLLRRYFFIALRLEDFIYFSIFTLFHVFFC